MKTMKSCIPVVLAGIMLCGCAGLQNALKVQRPTASLQGVRLGEINLETAGLLFDVEIQNPYPVDLPLVDLDYDVQSGSSKLFSGLAKIGQTIPAKNKAIVTLPAKVSYLDVFNALKSFKPGATIPYKANVGLSVDAPAIGVIKLPLSQSGELAVPALPKPTDVNWQNLLEKVVPTN